MSDESKLRVKINEWGKFENPSVLLHIKEGETEINLEEVEDVARHVLGMYEEIATLRRAIERFLIAWNTGELQCDVANGRFWSVLRDFKELTAE